MKGEISALLDRAKAYKIVLAEVITDMTIPHAGKCPDIAGLERWETAGTVVLPSMVVI